MSAPTAPAPAPQPQTSVLVVDDTPANLDLLIDLLDSEGIEVQVAVSGQQALDTVVIAPPDLVLLDVRMPEMDGFETYRRLRAIEGFEALPIVFVTAEGDVEMVSKGAELGGIDYVTKPFDKHVLMSVIRTHLR